MLATEIIYSLISLVSVFCVTFIWHHRFGVLLGVVMQFLWIHHWLITGQEGILLLDGGILLCCSVKYYLYTREL